MKRFLLVLLVSVTSVCAQSVVSSSAFGGGEGVNGEVLAVAIQPDGKIVIGGKFTSVNGQPRNNVARLNPDGSLDSALSYAAGVNGVVSALAVAPDGSVIVGGVFTQANQKERMNLARYKADGSFDDSFSSPASGIPGTNGPILALTVQPDGKIVIGGNFNTVFGQPRRSVARINPDGTLDGPLTAQNAVDGDVKALASSARGSVAGGAFTMQNQDARNLLQIPAAQQ